MQAIVLTKYGERGVLKLLEVPKPVPKDNEVLLKVHATTVNDWDWCVMRGKPAVYRSFMGLWKPKVTILGAEVAGHVEGVGAGAQGFKPGDVVYGDISEMGFGGFAEYVCVRESALVHKPECMTFEEAASIPHAFALARQGLVDEGHIQEGQRVLINGAGGGVGNFGVQLAKHYGAETTGVDSGPKLETMREMGFDHVIDYRQEDFTQDGERYDLILDTKTNRPAGSYRRVLKPNGTYVTVGGQLLRLLQILVAGSLSSRVSSKRMRIVSLKTNKDLNRANELFEAGKLTRVLDGPYQLADVPEAVQHFGAARHKGKVVVSVGNGDAL